MLESLCGRLYFPLNSASRIKANQVVALQAAAWCSCGAESEMSIIPFFRIGPTPVRFIYFCSKLFILYIVYANFASFFLKNCVTEMI
jgi:hypothetical protein